LQTHIELLGHLILICWDFRLLFGIRKTCANWIVNKEEIEISIPAPNIIFPCDVQRGVWCISGVVLRKKGSKLDEISHLRCTTWATLEPNDGWILPGILNIAVSLLRKPKYISES
jgi:hypothetical protein